MRQWAACVSHLCRPKPPARIHAQTARRDRLNIVIVSKAPRVQAAALFLLTCVVFLASSMTELCSAMQQPVFTLRNFSDTSYDHTKSTVNTALWPSNTGLVERLPSGLPWANPDRPESVLYPIHVPLDLLLVGFFSSPFANCCRRIVSSYPLEDLDSKRTWPGQFYLCKTGP